MEPLFFFFLLVALALLASFFIFYPLFLARPPQATPSQASVNLAAYQLRLQELHQDLASGLLSDSQYAAAKVDLDAQLLEDIPNQPFEKNPKKQRPWLSGTLLLLLTISASFFWYQNMGSWQQAHAEIARQAAVKAAAPQLPEDFVKAMENLAARLARGEGQWQEWLILAQSYTLAERFAKARKAYASAYQLNDGRLPTPGILGYVEVLLLTDSEPDFPAQLLETLLAAEPNNLEALWFAGLVAMQQGKFPDSLRFWYQLVSLENRLVDSPEIQGLINDAEQAVGIEMKARLQAKYLKVATPVVSEASETAPIQVHLQLSPEAAAAITGEETVFVFAQPLEGSPMPLAALRLSVKELPTAVTLDDRHAMVADLPLSKATQVRLGARVSNSGQASPQSGDWQGSAGVVAVNSKEVFEIIIDSRLP